MLARARRLRFRRPPLPRAGGCQCRPVLHSPTPERECKLHPICPSGERQPGLADLHRRWFHLAAQLQLRSLDARARGHLCQFRLDLDRRHAGARHSPPQEPIARNGALGLTSVHGAYFANFAGDSDRRTTRIRIRQRPEAPLPPGVVPAWQVSPAIPEADGMARAARGNLVRHSMAANPGREPRRRQSLAGWRRWGMDTTPILRASRCAAPAARTAAMEFGFSDRVHIYLNGQLLYFGHDEQGSRDYRFLGIIGFWDTLYLPLRAGANEVTFVVTDETNGGTAAAARFAADAGLRFGISHGWRAPPGRRSRPSWSSATCRAPAARARDRPGRGWPGGDAGPAGGFGCIAARARGFDLRHELDGRLLSNSGAGRSAHPRPAASDRAFQRSDRQRRRRRAKRRAGAARQRRFLWIGAARGGVDPQDQPQASQGGGDQSLAQRPPAGPVRDPRRLAAC